MPQENMALRKESITSKADRSAGSGKAVNRTVMMCCRTGHCLLFFYHNEFKPDNQASNKREAKYRQMVDERHDRIDVYAIIANQTVPSARER
jgi:hypothetical protein